LYSIPVAFSFFPREEGWHPAAFSPLVAALPTAILSL